MKDRLPQHKIPTAATEISTFHHPTLPRGNDWRGYSVDSHRSTKRSGNKKNHNTKNAWNR